MNNMQVAIYIFVRKIETTQPWAQCDTSWYIILWRCFSTWQQKQDGELESWKNTTGSEDFWKIIWSILGHGPEGSPLPHTYKIMFFWTLSVHNKK